MDPALQELLERRCRRAIAIVLSAKERDIDAYLPNEVQTKFRKVILDQFNDLTALATDLLESAAQGSIYNELWLERIEAIHEAVVPRD